MNRSTACLGLVAALPFAASAADLDPLTTFDRNVAAGARHAPHEVVVTTVPGTSPAEIEVTASALSCAVDHQFGHHPVFSLRCADVRGAIAAWQHQHGVVWVDAAFAGRLTATPNDLTSNHWWHLNAGQRIGGRDGTAGADIGSIAAWDLETGDPAVVVAVLDTGVRVTHEDVAAQIWRSPTENCTNGLDDDGNGYVDDCRGWDMGDADNDVDPTALPATTTAGTPCAAEHGTFIASMAAATGDDATGGPGVGWDLGVMPLKIVTDADCSVYDTRIAEALYYAADNGARVLNASWQFSAYTATMESAFAYADAAGVIAVIAAGNDNTDNDSITSYPIDFGVGRTLVVAATNNVDAMSSFSNWGATEVDLAAPGEWLYGATVDGDSAYDWGSGTSYAAPLVAGAAALVWSAWPSLSPDEVIDAILDGSTPLSGLSCGSTTRCVATGGRLDVEGALSEAAIVAATLDTAIGITWVDDTWGDGDGVLERGETALVTLRVRNRGDEALTGVTATLRTGGTWEVIEDGEASVGTVPGGDSVVDVEAAFAVRVRLACNVDHVVAMTGTLFDAEGHRFEHPFNVSVPCVIDEDGDGSLYPDDCDDLDPEINPSATEVCNHVDDDCNGVVDDGVAGTRTWYVDADQDGFGDSFDSIEDCQTPAGYAQEAGDCDDDDPDVNPDAVEHCDDRDEDCNGFPDDAPIDGTPVWPDGDGDGLGDPAGPYSACGVPAGYVDNDLDCDDTDSSEPGSDGVCDAEEEHPWWSCACSAAPSTQFGWFVPLLLPWLRRRR